MPSSSATSSSGTSRRLRPIGVGLAVAAIAALLIAGLTRGDGDPVVEDISTAVTPSAGPTTPPQAVEDDKPLDQDDAAVDSTVPLATATALPIPTPLPPLTDCLRSTDLDVTDAQRATATIRSSLIGAGDVRCFDQDLASERGGVYWMPLRSSGQAGGGALAIGNETGGFDVVLLELGPWNSYQRIGGAEGANAPAIAGLPTGNVVAERGGFSIEVTGDAYLYGESATSTFYWMTKPILDSWIANGAHESLLGRPASSVYEWQGLDRVDFTGGFITHQGEERAVVNSISKDRVVLPPNVELRGQLVSARDGTGWFVDDFDRRWWVPNVQTWFCAGGDSNRVVADLPGYAIHRLALGGVATCPLGVTGTNPAAGGVEVQAYCTAEVNLVSSVSQIDGGWACDTPDGQVPVDHQALCTWQYGVGANSGGETEPFSWTCTSS